MTLGNRASLMWVIPSDVASRVLLPAVAASVAGHVMAILWLSSGSTAGAGRTRSHLAEPPQAPALSWTTVELLVDDTELPSPVAVQPPTSRSRSRSRSRANQRTMPSADASRARLSSDAIHTSAELSGTDSAADLGGSGLDEPPRPEPARAHKPIVIPSAADAARLVVTDRGPRQRSPLEAPTAEARQARSEIRSDGKGEYKADDLSFKAAIKRDGRVAIKDKPNLWVRVAIPRPRDIVHHLRNWYADPAGVAQKNQRSIETHTIKIIEGGFDLTDWAVRKGGGDPYYHRKKAFLDRTRAQRTEMARQAQRENLRDSIAGLKAEIDRIWRDRQWSTQRRRRLLFDLWDECAEVGSTQVLTAGKAARATVLAFVRRRLARGGTDAYSEDELRELNLRRQSRLEFRPYQ